MRKIKEVLRLRFELGLQQNQIARSCSIGQATVHRYLQRAAAAGLSWPLAEDLDDSRLQKLLFREARARPSQSRRSLPEFNEVRRQLQTHKHVTLQLVWEEYRETQPDGYSYSQFCDLYRRWRRNQDVVLRQEHRAGEKLFVDWAGDTIPIYDARTAEVTPASLFVAVLGASTYTFARATLSQDRGNWVECHVAAFEYCQGAPRLVVPDNPRTGVNRACRYEPDLNRTYQEMAAHYGVAVLPARPRKPRDKAKVENAVLIAERWIIAALRHRKFYNLADLSCWKSSTPGPSANARDRGPACLPNWTAPPCNLCRRNATSWHSGKPCALPSITTWRWTVIITVFPTNWPARSWRLVRRPLRLRSSITADVLPHIPVTASHTGTPQ
jgi:transposase